MTDNVFLRNIHIVIVGATRRVALTFNKKTTNDNALSWGICFFYRLKGRYHEKMDS